MSWIAGCSSSSEPGRAASTGDASGAAGAAPASGGATASPGEAASPAEAAPPPSPGAGTAEEALDPDRIENVQPGPDGTPAARVPSPGCGLTPPEPGQRSLEVGGSARTFLLDLPPSYDGTQPLPLVFAFHGATTSGALFRSPFYGNLLSSMAAEAIVVHPDALGDPTSWNNQADVPFFDALVVGLGEALCVDMARVFATGHSSGGFFTNTLGCQRGDVLRAIAPVSAGGPFGGNDCRGEVAVWLAHAENDDVVAFENGVASRDRWLEANGCSEETSAAAPEPCVEYAGCGDGLPVRWCVYQDGHDWPEFGPDGIWSFFRSL